MASRTRRSGDEKERGRQKEAERGTRNWRARENLGRSLERAPASRARPSRRRSTASQLPQMFPPWTKKDRREEEERGTCARARTRASANVRRAPPHDGAVDKDNEYSVHASRGGTSFTAFGIGNGRQGRIGRFVKEDDPSERRADVPVVAEIIVPFLCSRDSFLHRRLTSAWFCFHVAYLRIRARSAPTTGEELREVFPSQ